MAGRVAALIELGAGFHPEISGRENVFINGAVLGLTRKQIERRYAEIVEFSGLGDFMEEPVKNYSSGMYVRLGFAVAVNTDPDVLLVDEVLAVGDEAFAHRCLRRIEEFLAAGKTLLLVSHSLDLVEGVCDRVLWLDNGRQRLVGEPRRVIDAYRQEVAEREGEEHLAAKRQREQSGEEVSEELRWGSREAEIVALRTARRRRGALPPRPAARTPSSRSAPGPNKPLDDFVFGVAVSTPRGLEVWGTNTDIAGYAPGLFEGEATVRLACPALRLAPGEYLVDVAIQLQGRRPLRSTKAGARLHGDRDGQRRRGLLPPSTGGSSGAGWSGRIWALKHESRHPRPATSPSVPLLKEREGLTGNLFRSRPPSPSGEGDRG